MVSSSETKLYLTSSTSIEYEEAKTYSATKMDQLYFGHKLAVNKEYRGVYNLHYSIDICMILRGY